MEIELAVGIVSKRRFPVLGRWLVGCLSFGGVRDAHRRRWQLCASSGFLFLFVRILLKQNGGRHRQLALRNLPSTRPFSSRRRVLAPKTKEVCFWQLPIFRLICLLTKRERDKCGAGRSQLVSHLLREVTDKNVLPISRIRWNTNPPKTQKRI